jgi:chromosome segregation ATPase
MFLSEGPQAPADRSAEQNNLAASADYQKNLNRVFVVCGVRAGLNAIGARANELVQLSDYVLASATQERAQFITDHATLIDQIREQAALVAFEQKLYSENTDRLASATQVVKERTVEIEKVEEELKKAREATDVEIRKLREKSYEVLKLRQKIRDTIDAIERGEKTIRDLEKQATTLDNRNL